MTNTNDPAYVSDDTGVVLGTLITDQPLESLAAAAYDDVMVASMGACVTFNGVVRNHDGGQRVRSLSYTSHPTAEAIMATVADKVLDRRPDVRIWAAHRIGGIAIGEAAFVVHVASAHRDAAFRACSDMADTVKAEVPIWKEQLLESGDTQWVGLT